MKNKEVLTSIDVSIKLETGTLHQFAVENVKMIREDTSTIFKQQKIIKAIPDKKRNGKVIGVKNYKQIKESICFTDETRMEDLEKVIDGIIKHHGKAALVTVQPTFSAPIPIIVLEDENVIEALKDNKTCSNCLMQICETSPSSESKENRISDSAVLQKGSASNVHEFEYELSAKLRNDELCLDSGTLKLKDPTISCPIRVKDKRFVEVRTSDNGKRIFNSKEAKGSICVLKESNIEVIDNVVSELAREGAEVLLLIVSALPSFVPKIPVVLDNDDLFKKLTRDENMRHAKVDFSLRNVLSEMTGAKHGGYEESYEPNPDVHTGNIETSSRLTHVPNDAQPLFEGNDEKKKGGANSSFLSGVIGAIGAVASTIRNVTGNKPKCHDKLVEVFSNDTKWTTDGNTCYARSVVILYESSQDHFEMNEILKQLMSHLNSSTLRFDVLKLSFCIQVHNAVKSPNKERNGLYRKIINLFHTIDVDISQQSLSEFTLPLELYQSGHCSSNAASNPHQAIIEFFDEKLKTILVNLSPTKAKMFLFTYTGIALHHCKVKEIDYFNSVVRHIDLTLFHSQEEQAAYSQYFQDIIIYQSLALVLQNTLEDFFEVYDLLLLASERPKIIVLNKVLNKFKYCLENSQAQQISSVLPRIIKVFNTIRVKNSYGLNPCRQAIETFLHRSSYSLNQTFDYFIAIWDSVDIEEDECYSMITSGICNKIRDELKDVYAYDPVNLVALMDILTHQIGYFILATEDDFQMLQQFVCYRAKNSLKVKIEFLDKLLSVVTTREDFNNEFVSSFLVDTTLKMIQKNINHIKKLFSISVEDGGNLYRSQDSRNSLVIDITTEVVKAIVTNENVSKLSNQDCVLLFSNSFCPDSFADTLQQAVVLNLQKQYGDIEALPRWFEASSVQESETELDVSGWDSVRQKVAMNAINLWEPSSFAAIAGTSAEALNVINACLREHDNIMTDAAELSRMKEVTELWVGRFNNNALPIAEVEKVCNLLNFQKYETMKSIFTTCIPTLEDVRKYITESQELCKIIYDKTFIEAHERRVSIRFVLHEYKVDIDTLPHVGETIALCDKDFSEVKQSLKSISLEQLRMKCHALKDFLLDFQEPLITATYFIGKKSSLYNDIIAYGGWSHLTFEEFVRKVSFTRVSLTEKLSCEGGSAIQSIEALTDIVGNDNEGINVEFDLVQMCPTIEITESHKARLLLMVTLVKILKRISGFVNCSKQLQFEFAQNDEKFQKLEDYSYSMTAENNMNLSFDALEELSQEIQMFFWGDMCLNGSHSLIADSLDSILPIMSFMTQLSFHSEIWVYIKEMKWFGEEGLRNFNTMFENMTNVFLADCSESESFEMAVLDCLEPCVRTLNYVEKISRKELMKESFQEMKNNLDIMDGEKLERLLQNLKVVQENITSIRGWFERSCDEVTSMFSKLSFILKSGHYDLDGKSDELCLHYLDANKKKTTLVGDKLNHDIQQLSFIKHEKPDKTDEILSFTEQFHLLKQIVHQLNTVRVLGFDDSNYSFFPCRVSSTNSEKIELDLKSMLLECEQFIDGIYENSPTSLLIGLEELLQLDEFVQVFDEGEVNPIKLRSLKGHISKVLGLENRHTLKDSQLLDAIMDYVQMDSLQLVTSGQTSQLENVSVLLETINKATDDLLSPSIIASDVDSGIILHSCNCSKSLQPLANLLIFSKVLKERLPQRFEVYDCKFHYSSEKLKTFLRRVDAFPKACFFIFNVHCLHSEEQESIFNFISRPDKNCNLHCVQSMETMLHACPWVESMIWDDEKVQAETCNFDRWATAHVRNNDLFQSISIVSSPQSGSGKTKSILEALDKIKHDDANAQVTRIVIHEGSTVKSIVENMCSKFQDEGKLKAVYFALMTPLDSDNERLREVLNYVFESLLLTRAICDPENQKTFYAGTGKWRIFLETVSHQNEVTASLKDDMIAKIPILAFCADFLEPRKDYVIDEKARRVCTYLRAFENGTIDRKFNSLALKKQLMFVIDKSGSMQTQMGNGKTALDVAIDNAIGILESHVQVDDIFGTMLFDHMNDFRIPLQPINCEDEILSVRNQLNQCRHIGGGTSMYSALLSSLQVLARNEAEVDSTWIVCLTDGVSDNKQFEELRISLSQSSSDLHVIMIGVNLHYNYSQQMQNLCNKFGANDDKSVFIPSEAEVGSLNTAFGEVASRLPVSKTFELDGLLSDDECRDLIKQHIPICANNMMSTKFWIEFLYRRVKVFDQNDSFNYNETHEHLGSSLMRIMLDEAERLLSKGHNKAWKESNHEQLIYDFTKPDSPEFRLICTAPDMMTEEAKKKYGELDLPGFFIPSNSQLQKRDILDHFLSQALDIPLVENGDSRSLSCIDENRFILTLDFTMKILNIHERIACHIPCIIEGETGVSKTAITKMYSILRNSSLKADAEKSTADKLREMESTLFTKGFLQYNDDHSSLDNILHHLRDAAQGTMSNVTEMGRELYTLLMDAVNERSVIFQDVPSEFRLNGDNGDTEVVTNMLKWFSTSHLEKTFFEINIDSSLTEAYFVKEFQNIQETAKKVEESNAIVVVFLDEINTSSVLGLLKEIVVDHCFCGIPLHRNIVVVAACNPAGRKAICGGSSARENDLGKEWVSGHYQVNKLPQSMELLKWEYGSLDSSQEKEFVFRRLEMIGASIPDYQRNDFTELIVMAHEAIRDFAYTNIMHGFARHDWVVDDNDLKSRAKSTVSLRDIQRVFSLFQFFVENFPLTIGKNKESMNLSIAVVYYFQLDQSSRQKFVEVLQSYDEDKAKDFSDIVDKSMNNVVEELLIPEGIALTNGLKENIFMTIICSMSFTPLMIIGPPGSSKTLSVNMVSDNCNGEESPTCFYRKFPRLSTFHYQCSKTSTSKEVASVFESAIQRQAKHDPLTHKCMVFMDEAGLPEEEKESLKVLHYYLEGHMSMKAKVGFVAITNHILDAAKSNRCVSLLRQEPDKDEMMRITKGVLFNSVNAEAFAINSVDYAGRSFEIDLISQRLCQSYQDLMKYNDEKLDTFFGLRDFIYFLKYLRKKSTIDVRTMTLTPQNIFHGIERNFNGTNPQHLKAVASCFLSNLSDLQDTKLELPLMMRQPFEVISDALHASEMKSGFGRYSLLIDETGDDSIMRLLVSEKLIDTSAKSLFMLSNMPEQQELERINLVSGVKYAALKGTKVVMSQTDSLNESFYDLFNQNFRKVTLKDGDVGLFANIAIGGVSRRSRIDPSFHCVVQVRLADLSSLPAPFLNRFEKFRLSVQNVLEFKLKQCAFKRKIIFQCIENVQSFVSLIGEENICGYCNGNTIESFYLDFISSSISLTKQNVHKTDEGRQKTFVEHVTTFANNSFESASITVEEIVKVAQHALKCIPRDQAIGLKELMSKNSISNVLNLEQSFYDLVSGKSVNTISNIVETLLEMVLSRRGISCILGLVTPDAVFMKRGLLPNELINEYFSKEHFSLKKFIELTMSKEENDAYNIVHTRSDASILRIPSFRSNSNSDCHPDALKILPYAENMIIEHLCSLKNEASVRNVIKTWVESDHPLLLMLIVDMGDQTAREKVNFVRCSIDQCCCQTKKKIIMILHYPPAMFLTKSFYPALFLSEWRHHFVDGGTSLDEGSTEIKNMMLKACIRNENKESDFQTAMKTDNLMQVGIKSIAGWNIFYDEQLILGNDPAKMSYGDRFKALKRIFHLDLQGTTICEILTSKFASIWSKSRITQVLKHATTNLEKGNSQLPITVCLHGFLQDSMHQFLAYFCSEINAWKNLDILTYDIQSKNSIMLFREILIRIPVIPFEELILSRASKPEILVLPGGIPTNMHLFPFFSQVSKCLNKVVETVMNEESYSTWLQTNNESFIKDVLSHLSDPNKARKINVENNMNIVVYACLNTMTEGRYEDLFQHYLHQYIVSVLGCDNISIAGSWFEVLVMEATNTLDTGSKVIMIHFIHRAFEMHIFHLCSCRDFPSTFHDIFKPCLLEDRDSSTLSYGLFQDSTLFMKFLNWFESRIDILLGSEEESSEWTLSFSLFINRLTEFLCESYIDNDGVSDRLRMLSFLYILKQEKVHNELLVSLIGAWYKNPEQSTHRNTSLMHFSGIIDEMKDVQKKQCCKEALLKHFFSRTWLSNVACKWEEDLRHLSIIIKGTEHELEFHQLSLILIQNSCLCSFQIEKNMFPNTKIIDSTVKMSSSRLRCISSTLDCNGISTFSSEGRRINLPRYLPYWWQNTSCQVQLLQEDHPTHSSFFGKHECSFVSSYADVVFDMVLKNLAESTKEHISSEKMVLALCKNVEIENNLSRDEQSRLSRVRTYHACSSMNEISFTGSPLSILIIEAQLVLFILKVSFELVNAEHVDAFCGVYSGLAQDIFNQTMSEQHWQIFFLLNIIRIKGEGFLINMLETNEVLSNMDWVRKWKEGIPTTREGHQKSLQEAEEEFHEATNEENRKTGEFLLCPHCRQPFIVLQQNCGQFVCGRHDTHVTPTYNQGCGQAFSINDALPYVKDDAMLQRLSSAVDSAKSDMENYINSSKLWEELHNSKLPYLISNVTDYADKQTYIPTSFAYNTVGCASELLRHLMRCRLDVTEYMILPDLIELYQWIHVTFKTLLTIDQAVNMKLDEVLKEETLSRRFDSSSVKHIIKLWNRVNVSLDSYLLKKEGQIQWNCETIKIPFSKTNEVTFMMFLSVYEHPTEGYDYLFVIINDIIQHYNYFIMKLNECKSASPNLEVEEKSVSPSTILSGSFAETAISSLKWLSTTEFDHLVERFRLRSLDKYDVEKLEVAVCEELAFCEFTIDSPLNHLRRQFQFRESIVPKLDEKATCFKSSNGYYFAHIQDLQLFEDCQTCLKLLNFGEGDDAQIRNLLVSKFNGLDYESLRSTLAGLRLTFQQMEDVHAPINKTDSLGKIFLEEYASNQSEECNLFPSLSETQVKTILSLKPSQLVELIHFIGYQLASESHAFSSLPLSMNIPISNRPLESLRQNISNVTTSINRKQILDAIHEFKGDILSFYQNEIREHCSSSNQSLRVYLQEQNFCDDSDAIFKLLPCDITVRNYIPLQQELHQIKLRLSCLEGRRGKGDDDDDEDDDDFSTDSSIVGRVSPEPRRGKSLYWTQRVVVEEFTRAKDEIIITSDIDEEEVSFEDDLSFVSSNRDDDDMNDLWFEFGRKVEPLQSVNEDDNNNHDEVEFLLVDDHHNNSNDQIETDSDLSFLEDDHIHDIMPEARAASIIQNWWRTYRIDNMNIMPMLEEIDNEIGDNLDHVVRREEESVNDVGLLVDEVQVLSDQQDNNQLDRVVDEDACIRDMKTKQLSLENNKQTSSTTTMFASFKQVLDIAFKVAFCVFVLRNEMIRWSNNTDNNKNGIDEN